MTSSTVEKSATLDDLDKRIVRALQLSPRAPFRQLAEALDVSEQTVARRYRALHRGGVLRVVGIVDPTALGESVWILRIRSRPDATLDLGRALAQRVDVGWVSVTAGGAELICAVFSPTRHERDRLIIDRLPRTSAVLDLAASVILRRFAGGRASDWIRLGETLTDAQEQAIAGSHASVPELVAREGREPLEPEDFAIINALARDGRASYATLAAAAGTTEGRATRRLAALLAGGAVYLDVDLSSSALGFPTAAYLSLTVAPGRLDAICRALAEHDETPFVAAISGRANVLATVVCRSLDELYAFVTDKVGPLEGVQTFEVSPVLHRIKQAGTQMDGDRLSTA